MLELVHEVIIIIKKTICLYLYVGLSTEKVYLSEALLFYFLNLKMKMKVVP